MSINPLLFSKKIQSSHLHLGKMKKDTNTFRKNGIYISIEGEQYDFKNAVFEELIFEAYIQSNLEEFLNQLHFPKNHPVLSK